MEKIRTTITRVTWGCLLPGSRSIGSINVTTHCMPLCKRCKCLMRVVGCRDSGPQSLQGCIHGVPAIKHLHRRYQKGRVVTAITDLLALRPVALPSRNLQYIITHALLRSTTGVSEQFPGRDFNALDRSPMTACDLTPVNRGASASCSVPFPGSAHRQAKQAISPP